jgi:hypothetical protein
LWESFELDARFADGYCSVQMRNSVAAAGEHGWEGSGRADQGGLSNRYQKQYRCDRSMLQKDSLRIPFGARAGPS